MSEDLKRIISFFIPDQKVAGLDEITSGHINDTYLITSDQHNRYVFQRINQSVFKDVPGLIMNKVRVSRHLHQKMASIPFKERRRKVLTFLKNVDGGYFVQDKQGNYWSAAYFVENSLSFETVKSSDIAYEGGKLFGTFLKQTEDMDPEKLVEVLPRFHDMSLRFEQFEEALQKRNQERIAKAGSLIELAGQLKSEMMILEGLKSEGKIKLRVTHNDTKISNALFDTDKKGLCVIDTDTVMPGIIHYDFGDAIRTICNSAAEDERDLSKVWFSKDFYLAYTKGYLEALGDAVSDFEISYFPLAAKTMTFIMALRFLTDYLNGDIYYKSSYPDHNLDRSKNQFKLIKSFEEVMGPVV